MSNCRSRISAAEIAPEGDDQRASYHGPVRPWDRPSQGDNTIRRSLVPKEHELAPVWQGTDLATVRNIDSVARIQSCRSSLNTLDRQVVIPTRLAMERQPTLQVEQYHQPTKRIRTARS